MLDKREREKSHYIKVIKGFLNGSGVGLINMLARESPEGTMKTLKRIANVCFMAKSHMMY